MKLFHRWLSLLLCVLLALPSFVVAQAEEWDISEDATYVLNHDVSGDGYDGPDLQYFSPYRIQATMNGKEIIMKNCIFSLYNTLNGEIIPVYCTDISVLANSNYSYRRLNLEDSTFAANAAEQIRAIVRNGFYLLPIQGESDAEHAVRVKEELKRLGDAAGVPNLTVGEAITGTQCAIWQAAHGPELVIRDFVHTMYTTNVSDSVRYYEICDEERNNGHVKYTYSGSDNVKLTAENDKWIGSRIQAVYSYLLSCDPLPPTGAVVSVRSFQQINEVRAFDNGDGTCDVTVSATIKVNMKSGDYLNVTATLGDHYRTRASLSNGTQTVRLTLENVPADQLEQQVKLTISGMQAGFDVYLYDSEGDRETSQSMVGMNDSRLPVHASVSVTPTAASDDRILNIYKTTRESTGVNAYERHPLEGIVFDIYLVAELSDYLNGTVRLPEPGDYDPPETADVTLVTGEDGRASVNFTQKGMPDGVYLVVEREHPAIKAPVDPFYVIMPATNPEGTGHVYEITVQPKNDVKGGVRIEKDVVTPGNDSASVSACENHTWIIGTNIPEDISEGKDFVISDTLDHRLDFMGNLRVNVETADGQTAVATLLEGTDYILNVTDVDSMSEGTPSDAFRVTLTRAGMSRMGSSIGTGRFDDYMLRVYFEARINGNAEMGKEIPNRAALRYTNSVNFDFSALSDKPVVYTGGATLLKVDAGDADTVLAGAVFEVYRYATAEEVAAGDSHMTHIPGVSGAVVRVSFFDNEALAGEKVTSATSDVQGAVGIYGLAYGEYFLLETTAPDGYNRLDEAVPLHIDGTTHTAEQTVIVENVDGSRLPSTGGMGIGIYIITGFFVMCGAGLLLIARKRTNHTELS